MPHICLRIGQALGLLRGLAFEARDTLLVSMILRQEGLSLTFSGITKRQIASFALKAIDRGGFACALTEHLDLQNLHEV